MKPLYDGCASNREQWKKLAEQVDMGLTWIDHEYIEKPVERNDREGEMCTDDGSTYLQGMKTEGQ